MTAPIELLLHSYSLRFALWHDPRFDVFALLDRAVREGFAGVALNVNGPRYRFLGGDEPAHVARVADAIRERGLTVDIETSGTAPAHLERLLGLATRLGARNLRTYTRHAGPRAEVIAATVADLRAAAPAAAAAGVDVLLENHEEFTGVELARVLEAVDHPAVGALYDYGNSMMLHEEPHAALDAMLPWTRKAHLKDHVVLADGRVAGVPLGAGSVPIVELTRRLAEAGATRIAFENVWSYTCPLRPREDGVAPDPLGAGALAVVPPPPDAAVFLDDVLAVAEREPARVVALEEAAYVAALGWLHAALAAAGLATTTALGGNGREESRP